MCKGVVSPEPVCQSAPVRALAVPVCCERGLYPFAPPGQGDPTTVRKLLSVGSYTEPAFHRMRL